MNTQIPQSTPQKRIYVTETEAFSCILEGAIKDIALDFIDNICSLACKLCNSRGSSKLEEKDIILAISLLKPSFQ